MSNAPLLRSITIDEQRMLFDGFYAKTVRDASLPHAAERFARIHLPPALIESVDRTEQLVQFKSDVAALCTTPAFYLFSDPSRRVKFVQFVTGIWWARIKSEEQIDLFT